MIRICKPRNKDVAANDQKIMERMIQNKIEDIKEANVEIEWSIFKEIINNAAKEICKLCKSEYRKKPTVCCPMIYKMKMRKSRKNGKDITQSYTTL